MKIINVIGLTIFLLASFSFCKSKTANSINSSDWNGIYEGFIYCTDCEGIKVQIVLNVDETYQITYQYMCKNDTYSSSGKFIYDDNGIITLEKEDSPYYYLTDENTLMQLDLNKNPITSEFADMYVLKKQ